MIHPSLGQNTFVGVKLLPHYVMLIYNRYSVAERVLLDQKQTCGAYKCQQNKQFQDTFGAIRKYIFLKCDNVYTQ